MVRDSFSKNLLAPARPSSSLATFLRSVLACLLPLQPGHAADLDAKSVAGRSLEELLQTTVSVATRAEETFVSAPSSVTVFTAAEIRNMGIRTVEELLNYVPGLQATRTASRSTFSTAIRGRNNSSRLSNDILFMINGHRLNDDFSGAALVFNRYLTTANLEQVEIIRGPGSALYGSNAFLGVVNMVTSTDHNDVSLSAGDLGYRAAHANFSAAANGVRTAFFLGAFTDDGEKFIDTSGVAQASTRDARNSLQAYATVEADALRLDGRYSRIDLEDFWLFGTTPSSELNESRSEDYSADLSYAFIETDRARLSASAGYREIRSKNRILILPEDTMLALNAARLTDGADAYIGGPVAELSQTQLALDGHYKAGEAHELTAGLEYRRIDFGKLKNSNNYETLDIIETLFRGNPGPIRFYGDIVETADFGPTGSHRTIWSGYLQDVFRMNDSTKATFGLRYDHYSDFGSNVSPRLALVHSTARGATFKLMYGEAFRAPTVTELDTRNSPTLLSNPDLDAEKVRTFELAWLQEFRNVQTILTGYYSRIEDQILRTSIPGEDTRQTLVNGPGQDLSGVELEVHAELSDRWFLRATASHMFDLPEDPRNASRSLASLILNYSQDDWNVNLNGYYQASVETRTDPVEELDGYWLFNLNVRRDLGRLSLAGSIDNLFDEDYATFTDTQIPGGTPNRGRTYRLALEYHF